jgi:hypothetical protein
MATPEVWVAKDDGSDLVRAGAIAAVGRDYNGTITIRLTGGEGAAVTLVAVAPHEGRHTPEDYHRQLIRVVAAQLADAAEATVIRPVWDEHGWRWSTEPL